jgi:hypothetical protein
MSQFERAEFGTICLIQESQDGRIVQIATTAEQSKMLQILLASMSKEQPFVQMGEEYDLVLKRSSIDFAKTHVKQALKKATKATAPYNFKKEIEEAYPLEKVM